MYLVKKTAYYSSLMLGIILFSFILFHMVPSDPARIILGPNAEESQVLSLQRELGLDKPLYLQFFNYLKKITLLDFGKSFVDGRPVFKEVMGKFFITLTLVFFSLLIILVYTLFGIHSVYLRKIAHYLNFLFISTPTFFSGLLLAILMVKYSPFSFFSGSFESIGDYVFFLFPAFVLALYPMGILSRILIEEMERILKSQFIVAANAFGVPKRAILYRYALRNAVIPYIAAFSNQLPAFFTGAFIVEVIFSVPGIGLLLIRSILERDFPMLEGIIIMNGLIFILTNLLFETVYPLVDPRIRKS